MADERQSLSDLGAVLNQGAATQTPDAVVATA